MIRQLWNSLTRRLGVTSRKGVGLNTRRQGMQAVRTAVKTVAKELLPLQFKGVNKYYKLTFKDQGEREKARRARHWLEGRYPRNQMYLSS